MGIPRKDALLKAKSDVSDPRMTAEIKRSLEKERKTTNRVVKEAVKESLMKSTSDYMESMESVSKSIKEGMSEGFRIIAESMKEVTQRIKSWIEIKNNQPDESQNQGMPVIRPNKNDIEEMMKTIKVLQTKVARMEEKNREVKAQLNNMNTLIKTNEKEHIKEYIPAVMINNEGENLENNLEIAPAIRLHYHHI